MQKLLSKITCCCCCCCCCSDWEGKTKVTRRVWASVWHHTAITQRCKKIAGMWPNSPIILLVYLGPWSWRCVWVDQIRLSTVCYANRRKLVWSARELSCGLDTSSTILLPSSRPHPPLCLSLSLSFSLLSPVSLDVHMPASIWFRDTHAQKGGGGDTHTHSNTDDHCSLLFSQIKHIDHLKAFIEAQELYHQQCAAILAETKEELQR